MASLLYGLAGKLAGDLCSPLLRDYVGKPWELGTKSEFEKIKITVSAIQSVLLDAEEKQWTNREVQNWLKKIELVLYDLEDLLQEIRTEDLKRQVKTKNRSAKKVHIFFSNSNQLKIRFKIGRKVKLIRERLDAIASGRYSFNFTERHEEMNVVGINRMEGRHSFVPIQQFIGRDVDKDCVIKHLLQSDDAVDNNVSIVSIVGIGGMGKTTLAQSVYDSEEVKRNFELRMWFCISDPFDVKVICENVVISATHKGCKRLPMKVVMDKLKNSIDGKKYLLVLDDTWIESSIEWDNLKVLLSGGAKGSKILITARSELVARAAMSNATHVMEGLSHEDSWAVFKQIAFKQGLEQVSPTIEGIGKEVLEKCAGVPLVIKVMGSLLAFKEREIDWLDFKKNDLPQLTQDSEDTILQTLRLSYKYLPASLKRCFVYCAIFPKDYIISKEELIEMWVAHGFIQLDGTTRSLEDVGEQHFMDLLDRSFFEAHWRDKDGTVVSYKMHDLIHDLAQSVGGDDYYNTGSGANCMVESTHHAWVSGDELTNICRHGKKLRTLVLTRSLDEQMFSELTMKFKQLRVLKMRHLQLEIVPEFVGGLRHLYYLDLSENGFIFLPQSICSLYNLQTLLLSNCVNLMELPSEARDLVSLKRLDVSGCLNLRHMPKGLENLTCLQILNRFDTSFIGRSWEEGGKSKCAEVCDLESQVSVNHTLDLSYTDIKSLPEFISEYVAVRELKLKGCQLLMELGPEIGEFLNLEELDLEGTEIICLPKEIAKLINLKSLKFTLCGYADQFQETKQIASVIPQKALSNLLQLNELSIEVNPHGDWWNAEVKTVIDDLHCLQELKILRLYIPTVDLFGYLIQRIKLFIDQDSVCFRFTVGHHERLVSRLPEGVLKEFDDLEKFKKGLKFTSGEGMSIEITNALQRMDALLLERHWSINNLLEFGLISTENLKFCILSECNELQTLIDTKQELDYDGTVLSSLQHLSIHYMKKMQKIWRGPVQKGSLSNLKSLALYTCVCLTTVFKIDMLANLTNLEELRIEDCPKIKTLARSDFSDSMSQDFLPKLKSMLLLELPNLRCISSGLPIAPKLERLVIVYCPNLKKLSTTEISSKDLQVLKGTKGWWDALKWYESDVTEADQNYLTNKFIPLREDGDLEEQFLRD